MRPSDHNNTGLIPNLCQLAETGMLVVLSALLGMVFTLVSVRSGQSFWQALGFYTFSVLWISIVCGSVLCMVRNALNRLSITTIVLAVVVLVSLVTLGSTLAAFKFIYFVDIRLQSQGQLWQLSKNISVAVIITLIWLRYLYLRQLNEQTLLSEGDARFKALQAKIQPHFLFNTLNTIASLVSISPERAETMIERLADLMRGSLKRTSDDILVSDEVTLCQHYLAIEQERLGERLKVNWQVEDSTLDSYIPPFTLQPLIENAVYHGIQQRPTGGEVTIVIKRADDMISIAVSNPIPQSIRPAGNQMAQTNIQQRLKIRFGEVAKMLVQDDQQTYRVTLLIPVSQGKQE